MIYVSDPYDITPELFEAYPQIIKSESADIEILPVSVDNGLCESTKFTIFIQPEPNMDCNHIVFADRIKARPNHLFAVSGFVADEQHNWKDPYVLNFSNLTMTVRFNPGIPAIKSGDKPFVGTLMLGGWSSTRSIIVREIVDAGCRDKFIVSYFNRSANPTVGLHDTDLFYRSPLLDQLDSTEFVNSVFDDKNSGNTCKPAQSGKYGQHHWVSQIIPYQVYNKSYISVIAETESSNDAFFISEKIAKPLILGQPFVVFGGYQYLSHLKELGFCTFDKWLDETYDSVRDAHDRAQAVAQSAIKFSNLSAAEQQRSLQEMREVLDHNRRLVLDKSWTMKSIADAIIAKYS